MPHSKIDLVRLSTMLMGETEIPVFKIRLATS